MKKNKVNKKFTIILSLFIILFVILGVVLSKTDMVKIGQNQNKERMDQKQDFGLSTDPSDIQRTLLDTSNWKTYTNTKYGYTFKYPPEMQISYGEGDKLSEAHLFRNLHLFFEIKSNPKLKFTLLMFADFNDSLGSAIDDEDEIVRLNRRLAFDGKTYKDIQTEPRIIGANQVIGGYDILVEPIIVNIQGVTPSQPLKSISEIHSILSDINDTSLILEFSRTENLTQSEKDKFDAYIDTILSTFEFTK